MTTHDYFLEITYTISNYTIRFKHFPKLGSISLWSFVCNHQFLWQKKKWHKKTWLSQHFLQENEKDTYLVTYCRINITIQYHTIYFKKKKKRQLWKNFFSRILPNQCILSIKQGLTFSLVRYLAKKTDDLSWTVGFCFVVIGSLPFVIDDDDMESGSNFMLLKAARTERVFCAKYFKELSQLIQKYRGVYPLY